jgi:predicted phage tail protein
MTTAKLLTRLEILEQRVTALEAMPARLDALSVQIQQLRQQMHDGLSALREEIRAGDEETRRVLREAVNETRTHMLVLHEDLVERIKRLGDALSSSPSASTKNDPDAPGRKRSPR